MPNEPLPDFGSLDLAELATTTTHPTLAAVSTRLLAWWPSADEAVAAYEDTPPPPLRGRALQAARALAAGDKFRCGPDGP